MGLAAIQLARLYGAYVIPLSDSGSLNLSHSQLSTNSKTVTGTTSTAEKIDFMLNMHNGATHGVNYKTQDFAAEVKKITNGKGVDVIIDFVGRSHWQKNIDALGLDGRMTILAMLSGM